MKQSAKCICDLRDYWSFRLDQTCMTKARHFKTLIKLIIPFLHIFCHLKDIDKKLFDNRCLYSVEESSLYAYIYLQWCFSICSESLVFYESLCEPLERARSFDGIPWEEHLERIEKLRQKELKRDQLDFLVYDKNYYKNILFPKNCFPKMFPCTSRNYFWEHQP